MDGYSQFRVPGHVNIGQVVSNAAPSAGNKRKSSTNQGDEYAWERTYERSWEGLQEDEHGRLKTQDTAARRGPRSKHLHAATAIQRGVLRNLVVVLDTSAAMAELDLLPNRWTAVCVAVKAWMPEFFDQNPLASVAIATVSAGKATVKLPASTSAAAVIEAMKSLIESPPELTGAWSLQACVHLARAELNMSAPYGVREAVLIHGAAATCDAGDVLQSIQQAKDDHTKLSTISLCGELHVARHAAQSTGGTWTVPLDVHSLSSALSSYTTPAAYTAQEQARMAHMVRMGFPALRRAMPLPSAAALQAQAASMTQQQLEATCTPPAVLASTGTELASAYECPQCAALVTEVPRACPTCTLPLITTAHLARSWHHLFPVPTFVDVHAGSGQVLTVEPLAAANEAAKRAASSSQPAPGQALYIEAGATHCAGCGDQLPASDTVIVCPVSLETYCASCDAFIHDSLHNLPYAP